MHALPTTNYRLQTQKGFTTKRVSQKGIPISFLRTSAGRKAQQGFTLLIAVIFMSVMLAFGLALAALAYKQQVLASSAIESQYAFYAADAALECALYADQQQKLFAYTSDMNAPAPSMTCDGASPLSSTVLSHTASQWVIASRMSLDENKRCADVTVYKPASSGTTYLFSQGYDVACSVLADPAGKRFNARGINVRY